MKKAINMCGSHLPFTREILNAMASSVGTFIPYDWQILIKALLKPGEYLQWTMWFQDIARDHANRNAWSGAPQNQIIFEILTGTRQFDAIEAQIRCPPLLHDQLKTVALEAWDWITPQGEPTGSYIKILQGPNEPYPTSKERWLLGRRRVRGATPCSRSGGAAMRSYPFLR